MLREYCWSSFLALLLLSGTAVFSQEWRAYGGDPGGSKYSNLNQIHRGNVGQLKEAWVYDSGDFSDGSKWPSRSAQETTPLIIDGVLYLTTPFNRVIALDAETGKQLWSFDPKIDKSVRMNLLVNRGVSYWTNGQQKRIFLGDLEGRLWSIDPANGQPDMMFGTGGMVAVGQQERQYFKDFQYRITSPPAVCGNTIMTGGLVSDGAPQGPSGDVLAFDAVTGKAKWRFAVVPKANQQGAETWPKAALDKRGGANVWAPFSVDEKLGLVFAPTTSASYDFYGADREGANLYANSVVALDCETGQRRWHFQTTHHDLWDYDLPAQPHVGGSQQKRTSGASFGAGDQDGIRVRAGSANGRADFWRGRKSNACEQGSGGKSICDATDSGQAAGIGTTGDEGG
jgi:glucose dehydrogenase